MKQKIFTYLALDCFPFLHNVQYLKWEEELKKNLKQMADSLSFNLKSRKVSVVEKYPANKSLKYKIKNQAI